MSKEHEDTIARLMLEINRLHGELDKAHAQIAELDVHAQTVKKLTNRKELLKFLLDGNDWIKAHKGLSK